MSASADPVVVELANKVAKLSFFENYDGDAVLAEFTEMRKSNEIGASFDAATLKKLFLKVGYDQALNAPEENEATEPVEEDAENVEEETKEADEVVIESPAVEIKYSENAENILNILGADGEATSIDAVTLLSQLFLFKNGYGEPTLSYALKVASAASIGEGPAGAPEAQAAVESTVIRALRVCFNRPTTPIVYTHLRKAWRESSKYEKPEEEEEVEAEAAEEEVAEEVPVEEEGKGNEESAPSGTGDGDTVAAEEQPEPTAEEIAAKEEEARVAAEAEKLRQEAAAEAERVKQALEAVPAVLIDDFLAKVTEDEVLFEWLLKEIPIEIEVPVEEEEE